MTKFLLFFIAGLLMGAPQIVSANSPNVVIIYADDLGYGDLGIYGSPSIKTPRIDQLAQEGQKWTNFYVAAAVCTPSRSALMTGKYPVRTGLYGTTRGVFFPNAKGGIPDVEITLPEALKSIGYTTAIFGKWHLGDADYALPTRHGFDQWLGLPYSNDMDAMFEITEQEAEEISAQGFETQTEIYFEYFRGKNENPKSSMWNVPLIISNKTDDGYNDRIAERPADQTQLTKRYTEGAVDYIDQHAGSDKPFFLYVAHTMPHVPLFASEAFNGVSKAGPYGDIVSEIDWSVGEIRDALNRNNIAENTLVVFSSDNGPWLILEEFAGTAGSLKDGKQSTFEGGMRVPGIFWWPNTIVPDVIDDIGSVMDLYSTVLSLAGSNEKPNGLDSLDLSDAIKGGKSARDTMAYYRSDELYAYRKGQYKIHFMTEGSYGRAPEKKSHETPLLYHLGRDPGEKFNIAAQEPEILQDVIKSAEEHRSGMVIAPSILDDQNMDDE